MMLILICHPWSRIQLFKYCHTTYCHLVAISGCSPAHGLFNNLHDCCYFLTCLHGIRTIIINICRLFVLDDLLHFVWFVVFVIIFLKPTSVQYNYRYLMRGGGDNSILSLIDIVFAFASSIFVSIFDIARSFFSR